jgi:hypothetical protein
VNAVRDRAPGDLRVSDADRDRAVTELTGHFEAGRLDQAEFEERSSQALAAKTEGDLGELFADLPGREAPVGPAPRGDDAPAVPAHVGLPRPIRFGVARVAIAAVALLALARLAMGGLGLGGGPQNLPFVFVIIPILVVLAVVRRLAR